MLLSDKCVLNFKSFVVNYVSIIQLLFSWWLHLCLANGNFNKIPPSIVLQWHQFYAVAPPMWYTFANKAPSICQPL